MKPMPKGIAREAPLIREVFRIPREDHVPRQADIVVGKVGEHRRDVRGCTSVGSRGRVGSAVEVAGIALGFAAEKLIATLFLRGEGIGARARYASNFEVNGLTLDPIS